MEVKDTCRVRLGQVNNTNRRRPPISGCEAITSQHAVLQLAATPITTTASYTSTSPYNVNASCFLAQNMLARGRSLFGTFLSRVAPPPPRHSVDTDLTNVSTVPRELASWPSQSPIVQLEHAPNRGREEEDEKGDAAEDDDGQAARREPLTKPQQRLYDVFTTPLHDDTLCTFKYFLYVGTYDGETWVVVLWTDRSRTFQPLSILQRDVSDGKLLRKLIDMAWCDDDTAAQKGKKHGLMRKHWSTLGNADEQQKVRRRSQRLHASSRAIDLAASRDFSPVPPLVASLVGNRPLLHPEPLPPAVPAPERNDLVCCRCSNCGYCSPGRVDADGNGTGDGAVFVCCECVDNSAAPTTKVLQHGAPREKPVRVAIDADTDHDMEDLVSSLVDEVCWEQDDGEVDIVLLDYHAEGRSCSEHIEYIDKRIGCRNPMFVLVLSCWTDPSAQTLALQTLAIRHPRSYFLTFREPHNRRFDCFADCIAALSDSVAFIRAPALVFLSQLCVRRSEVVLFAASARSSKPRATELY